MNRSSGGGRRWITSAHARARHLVTLLASAAVFLVCAAGSAQSRQLASPRPTSSLPITLDVTLGTHAPLHVGVHARATLAGVLVLGVGLGGSPDAYADAVASVPRAYGMGQGQAQVIETFLGGAFHLRLEGGLRLAPELGIEFLVHYQMVRGGGSISTATVDALVGRALPWGAVSEVPVSGFLHGVGGELAWAFEPIDMIVVRLGLGATYFAGADVRLTVPPDFAPHVGPAEAALSALVRQYGIVPEGSIAVGVRFE